MSSPAVVLQTIQVWVDDGTLARNLPPTIVEAFLGFIVGSVLGVATALVFVGVRRVARVLNPLMSVLNSVPAVILAPLFTLSMGLGMAPKVVMAALLVYFAIFFSVYQGLSDVDRGLVDSIRVQGASPRDVVTNVMLPAVALWVVGGLRLAIGFAFLGAVVGEYLGATIGMGYLIAQGGIVGAAQETLAGMVVVAAIVLACDATFTRLGRRFDAWRLF